MSIEMTAPTTTEQFLELDRRDEAQMVAELEGRYLEEFVYEFQQGGKTIVGISWLGIQEAAREYGGIRVKLLSFETTEETVQAIVEAEDMRTNSSRLGMAAQSTTQLSGKPDPFAKPKALSKAQRNAIRALLPQALLKTWIQAKRQCHEPRAQQTGTNGGAATPLSSERQPGEEPEPFATERQMGALRKIAARLTGEAATSLTARLDRPLLESEASALITQYGGSAKAA